MRLAIKDETVRRNLELFQKLLEKDEAKSKLVHSAKVVTFLAYINRHTGEFKFPEKESSLNKKDWKLVTLRFRKEEIGECCEILEKETDRVPFTYNDLEKTARKVMIETVKILDRVAHHAHKQNTWGWLFHEISNLHLEMQDFVHEAWHPVDRLGAEKILIDKEPGSFLFRKDEFTTILEQELQDIHPRSTIACITLTCLERNGKISDFTLVCKNARWFFYDDDPSLESPSFESVYSLLDTMENELLFPVK